MHRTSQPLLQTLRQTLILCTRKQNIKHTELPGQELDKESQPRLARCPQPMVLQVPSSSSEDLQGKKKDDAGSDSSSSDESEHTKKSKPAGEQEAVEDDVPAEQDTENPAETQRDPDDLLADSENENDLAGLTQADQADSDSQDGPDDDEQKSDNGVSESKHDHATDEKDEDFPEEHTLTPACMQYIETHTCIQRRTRDLEHEFA